VLAIGDWGRSRKPGRWSCRPSGKHREPALQRLADKAIVSLNVLARLEKGGVDSRVSTVLAIQKALAKAGVEFLDADQKGEGVRLRSPKA
jgi:hypothetical protein